MTARISCATPRASTCPTPTPRAEKLVRIMSKIALGFTAVPERQDYLAVVRDENRKVVLRARLSLDIETFDAG